MGEGKVRLARWTDSCICADGRTPRFEPSRAVLLTCIHARMHVCMSSGTRENGIRDLVCGYGGKGREGKGSLLCVCVCM